MCVRERARARERERERESTTHHESILNQLFDEVIREEGRVLERLVLWTRFRLSLVQYLL